MEPEMKAGSDLVDWLRDEARTRFGNIDDMGRIDYSMMTRSADLIEALMECYESARLSCTWFIHRGDDDKCKVCAAVRRVEELLK